MNLRLYPMDRQICSLVFQSSATTDNLMKYMWIENSSLTFVQGLENQDEMTPEIRLLAFKFRYNKSLPVDSTTEVYDQIILDLMIERPFGYFVWAVSHQPPSSTPIIYACFILIGVLAGNIHRLDLIHELVA